MTNKPLVSVLMTVYNREKCLASSIESVLESRYDNFEFIIVDDCSTDNSYEIAKEYAAKDKRISLYRNEQNLGDYPNRNKAASYAKGKYLKYNDSDEELYYFGLEIMVECMERFPESPLGFVQIHDEKKHPYILSPEEAYKRHYFGGGFFLNAPTSSLIRREEFEKLGGFGDIRHRGDYDLWLRFGAVYPIVRLPAFMGWNYYHEGQELSLNQLYKKALTYNVSIGALIHDNCPLAPEDRKAAIKRWERGFIRNNIFGGLLKFKFRDVAYLMKECNISFGDMLSSL
ncbi:MAG: glycosyltransferase family 2 protein [Chitinophagales bacterium]|nr:glycosyltransferase family 2 protein [Chitinophagaceae bacterium]MCB9064634.1 glycosyltransferase family 2 protein [Chitinophagales bacterium]